MATGTPDAGETAAERFTRGEPISVPIDQVERALTDLWKAATAGGEGTVSRAALWNVVVPTREQDLARTRKMVDELAPLMPARVLVLVEEPGAEAADAEGNATDADLHATLESNLVARSTGARAVYSEEITLSGRRGNAHFGPLVRALLMPGLPSATLWLDPTLPEALLRRQLLAATDRLVLDTGACTRARQLLEVQRFAELAAAIPVADLGWLRLRNFRIQFAALFDAPVGGEPLLTARRVTINHATGCEPSALLLAAWLASTLGWLFSSADKVAPGSTESRFHFDRPSASGSSATTASGASIEVVLGVSPGECGTSGIVGMELDAGDGQTFSVRRTEQNHAMITSPIAPPRVIKFDSRPDAELCLQALGPAGRDPLYVRSLALASRLASFSSDA